MNALKIRGRSTGRVGWLKDKMYPVGKLYYGTPNDASHYRGSEFVSKFLVYHLKDGCLNMIDVEQDSIERLIATDANGNEIYEGDIIGDGKEKFPAKLRHCADIEDGKLILVERKK